MRKPFRREYIDTRRDKIESEIDCGCGRPIFWGQSHCFCDYEYCILGIQPTITLTECNGNKAQDEE